MAYYFPTGYNPYYPQVQQMPQMQMQQQMPQGQQMPQQQQNGGIVRVKNEAEAREYPIAPGYSMTFIDDSANYCYTKSLGYSQFDKPRFEKYRLVKEDVETPVATPPKEQKFDVTAFVKKEEFEPILARISKLEKLLPKEEKTK